MQTAIIQISQSEVFEEVAKTTSYTGAKMDGGEAYNRIRTLDADHTMLIRFWNEAASAVTEQLKPFINVVPRPSGVPQEDFYLSLSMSVAWDSSLLPSMQDSAFSFFVDYIVSHWFMFTNKQETTAYGEEATAMLDDVVRKAYYRKRPQRTIPTRS